MPLPPGSEKPRRDESDSRVSVVSFTQRRDELPERSPHVGIVVIRCPDLLGRKRLGVRVEPFRGFDSRLDQKLRNPIGASWVNHPNPKDGLVTAAGDVVKQLLERTPVEAIPAEHQVAERQIVELKAVREEWTFVAPSVGHQSAERVVRRRRRVLEVPALPTFLSPSRSCWSDRQAPTDQAHDERPEIHDRQHGVPRGSCDGKPNPCDPTIDRAPAISR